MNNQTGDDRATTLSPAASARVALIAGSPAVRETLEAAAADLGVIFVEAADAAGASAVDAIACCLAGAGTDEQKLAALRDRVGAAPILLVDDGEPGIDATAAVAGGALDAVPLADTGRLRARLRQAVALGRALRAPRHAALDGRMALHRALARTDGHSENTRALVFVAIDGVASLRRGIGLAASDRLMTAVGGFLLDRLRADDRIFRFGCGEYVLMASRPTLPELADYARALHASLVDARFGSGRHSTALTATVSWCALAGADDADSRLHALMDAVYHLREAGGDCCRESTFGTGQAAAGAEAGDPQWRARLEQALAKDRFNLAFQGITSLAGSGQPMFDVLLRYVDDRGTLIAPGEFLATAEQAALMPDIDRWVVGRALDLIEARHGDDVALSLFVRLSAATLAADESFVAWLRDVCKHRDTAVKDLVFSLREDDANTYFAQARRLAEALQVLGFRVALSHYGSTGESTRVLAALPASFVKLAPAFVREVLAKTDDTRLARVMADAHERDIKLIAEQIEDAASMARLWQAGINYVQGHFIQEPDTRALSEH